MREGLPVAKSWRWITQPCSADTFIRPPGEFPTALRGRGQLFWRSDRAHFFRRTGAIPFGTVHRVRHDILRDDRRGGDDRRLRGDRPPARNCHLGNTRGGQGMIHESGGASDPRACTSVVRSDSCRSCCGAKTFRHVPISAVSRCSKLHLRSRSATRSAHPRAGAAKAVP